MKLKNVLFLTLVSSTSSFTYSSYVPVISGCFPELDASQQDYPVHIATYKQWIETGYSEKEGERYPHLSTFKKIEENLEGNPPYTKIEATRFLMNGEEKVPVASYPITLNHLVQASSEEPDQRGYHYLETVLYRPLHQKISYRLPAIEGVEGLEQALDYVKYNYVLAGQELKKTAFNFTVEPQQDDLINGYYASRLLQKKPHSYIYNSDKNFFLLQYQGETLEPVNLPDIKANFNFLFETPHKIVLKPDSRTSNLNGFDWKGIFGSDPQQSGQWQQIKQDLSVDSTESYTLSHAEGNCFQTVALDPNVPNVQALQDLRLSSVSQLIESLDFRGRVFGQAEKQDVINLLKSMPQLKSLNLSKEETATDYNDLIPTLSTLTNLTSLNLTNGQITEENLQKIALIAGLELIPAAQPSQPVPQNSVSAPTSEAPPADPASQPTPGGNPESPAAARISPPVENGEPSVTPTPTVPTDTGPPVTEEVTSTTNVPAVTLNAVAVAKTDAAQEPATTT